jgi:hypothetical protein
MNMKWIRLAGLAMATVFAVVGLLFLLIPGDILIFFNQLSQPLDLSPAPQESGVFYLALAAAYMYLVTVLAILMARHPDNQWFPFLLANGKLSSAVLSLLLFVWKQPYLICLVNCLVDGLIALAAIVIYLKVRRLTGPAKQETGRG